MGESQKNRQRGQPVQGLEFVERDVGKRLAGVLFAAFAGLFLEEAGPDISDGLIQPLGEFLEVLLVEENLVLVVRESAVMLLAALALGMVR